jgi:predicted methyltransferase
MSRRPNPSRAIACAVVAAALFLGGCGTVKRYAYEGFDRDEWQQPERVVADLALAPGAKVADLGAGGGYFTFRLARAVGPDGRVYAVDIDAGMNEHVARQAQKEGLANVRTVLAATDDAKLPEPVDLLFTSNTYHHLEERVAYFRGVRERQLTPDGHVAIVEFRPGKTSHATARKTIEQEMGAAGFRLVKSFDYLERQHFLVFAPGVADPEEPAR